MGERAKFNESTGVFEWVIADQRTVANERTVAFERAGENEWAVTDERTE